jgi:hypothetical protein
MWPPSFELMQAEPYSRLAIWAKVPAVSLEVRLRRHGGIGGASRPWATLRGCGWAGSPDKEMVEYALILVLVAVVLVVILLTMGRQIGTSSRMSSPRSVAMRRWRPLLSGAWCQNNRACELLLRARKATSARCLRTTVADL